MTRVWQGIACDREPGALRRKTLQKLSLVPGPPSGQLKSLHGCQLGGGLKSLTLCPARIAVVWKTSRRGQRDLNVLPVHVVGGQVIGQHVVECAALGADLVVLGGVGTEMTR